MASRRAPFPKNDQEFLDSCHDTSIYPLNLHASNQPLGVLEVYESRLRGVAKVLCREQILHPLVVLVSLENSRAWGAQYFRERGELANYLQINKPAVAQLKPPSTTIYFICSDSPTEPLNITFDMLTLLLTYYQVMPQFLDFLFIFGKQVVSRVHGNAGLWYSAPLSLGNKQTLPLSKLYRSPRDFQLCYTLRAPEGADDEKPVPYRLFSVAIFHGLDFGKLQFRWIFVAASEQMKQKIVRETRQDASTYEPFLPELVEEHLRIQLRFHLIVCSWMIEEWKGYINWLDFLVYRFTCSTRPPHNPTDTEDIEIENIPAHLIPLNALLGKGSFPGPHGADKPSSTDFNDEKLMGESFLDRSTSFNARASEANMLEDRFIEAMDALDLGSSTLKRLRDTFEQFLKSPDFPVENSKETEEVFDAFKNNVNQYIEALDTHSRRVQTSLALLRSSQALLATHLSIEAAVNTVKSTTYNADQARESNNTAKGMDKMNRSMLSLTQKSTTATVSMGVITFVTLFFLPGTFITTFLSTDIVRYQSGAQSISDYTYTLGELRLFFAIVIPIMVIVFLASVLLTAIGRRYPGKSELDDSEAQVRDSKQDRHKLKTA